MQKLSFLYLVQCSLFDTDSRKRINVAFFCLFSCHEKLQSFRCGKDFQLFVNFGIFPFYKALGVEFYELELVFKVTFRLCAHGVVFVAFSFVSYSLEDGEQYKTLRKTTPCAHSLRVRNRFRIRINSVRSVWQLATTVAAILVLPIRHSGGFTFVAGWAIHLYIDQWSFLQRVGERRVKSLGTRLTVPLKKLFWKR